MRSAFRSVSRPFRQACSHQLCQTGFKTREVCFIGLRHVILSIFKTTRSIISGLKRQPANIFFTKTWNNKHSFSKSDRSNKSCILSIYFRYTPIRNVSKCIFCLSDGCIQPFGCNKPVGIKLPSHLLKLNPLGFISRRSFGEWLCCL